MVLGVWKTPGGPLASVSVGIPKKFLLTQRNDSAAGQTDLPVRARASRWRTAVVMRWLKQPLGAYSSNCEQEAECELEMV